MLHRFFQRKVSHYLIEIKSVFANFGSEKQFKVKAAYFITTEIYPTGEK